MRLHMEGKYNPDPMLLHIHAPQGALKKTNNNGETSVEVGR